MASRKEMDIVATRLPTQAWQHALIALGDAPAAAAVVARALDLLTSRYAHAIKDDFPRLFYRIFLQLLRRRQFCRDTSRLPARLLAALIPRSEAQRPPHPLELLTVAAPGDDGDWPRQGAHRAALVAALQLLPRTERQAFLLLDGGALDAADAAFACGCSRRALQRRRNRALRTLMAIFAAKGAAFADEAQAIACLVPALPVPDSGQAAALAAAFDASLARLASRRRKPQKASARVAGWALRHPHQQGGLLLALLLALAGGVIVLGRSAPAPDPSATDIHLLAGDAAIDQLLDPHFDEARHE
jgi:DNA-directed RNA polymerase specialized sigma24 family protein